MNDKIYDGFDTYVSKNGVVKYRARILLKGKRIAKCFKTIREAKIWLGKIEQVKRATVLGEKAVLPDSFRDLANKWMTECLDVYFSPSMRVNNREIFEKIFFPLVGIKPLTEISSSEWTELLNQLRTSRNWSNATFNRRRSLLMSFYNWCMEEGLALLNPMTSIRKLREIEKETKFLTPSELEVFFAAIDGNKHRVCFYILLNTGMRVSEALGLSWKDVDLRGGWIRISKIYCKGTKKVENRTKSGRVRIIGLNNALRDILETEKSRKAFKAPDDLIVAGDNGFSPGHNSIRFSFEQCLKAAGLEPRGIHELRHTFASHFMMSGGTLWDLKTILGHSSIDLSERYSHFSPSHMKEKAEKVSFEYRPTQKAQVVNLVQWKKRP